MRIIHSVLCVLAFPCALAAQSSWANLTGLKVGQKIQVVEQNSTKHSGTFLSVSGSAIAFREAAGERSVQKPDVRSVKLQSKRRLRHTLIGTGVGAAAGATAGAASAPSDSRGYSAAFVGAAGAFVGAAIGVLLPANDLIYSVER
jgi:hypothetical protein